MTEGEDARRRALARRLKDTADEVRDAVGVLDEDTRTAWRSLLRLMALEVVAGVPPFGMTIAIHTTRKDQHARQR